MTIRTHTNVTNGSQGANRSGRPPEDRLLRHKKDLHQQLIGNMDLSAIGRMSEDELRVEVRRAAEELCRLSSDLVSLERAELGRRSHGRDVRPGPAGCCKDPAVSDILVNGPKTVYVERHGRLSGARSSSTTKSTCSRSSSESPTGRRGGRDLPRWWTPGSPTAAG